jgi:hypothetical protein
VSDDQGESARIRTGGESSTPEQPPVWTSQFLIQTGADLDFVIGASWPVAMSRATPAEFKRRILAAAVSYQLQLRSIDGTMKRYIEPNQFDLLEMTLGETVNEFLDHRLKLLGTELRELHRPDPSFGQVGAEFTLFKLPVVLNAARILANRGLLLEVLPILRLILELTGWAVVAFSAVEEKVIRLKPQGCIPKLKVIYSTAGKLYGYLSKFSHWSYEIHSEFLHFSEGRTAVIHASPRQRAISLTLCLILLDIIVEAARHIYSSEAKKLVIAIQGTLDRIESRECCRMISEIAACTNLPEIKELQSLLR